MFGVWRFEILFEVLWKPIAGNLKHSQIMPGCITGFIVPAIKYLPLGDLTYPTLNVPYVPTEAKQVIPLTSRILSVQNKDVQVFCLCRIKGNSKRNRLS